VGQQIFSSHLIQIFASLIQIFASSEIRANYVLPRIASEICVFEFGKVKSAATVLVTCQMQTPALIRLTHERLPGLAYGEERIWRGLAKWIKMTKI
jgi:hypothetical protein